MIFYLISGGSSRSYPGTRILERCFFTFPAHALNVGIPSAQPPGAQFTASSQAHMLVSQIIEYNQTSTQGIN
jgi:hypothetical protein